jgi:ABC-type enterochelin transport system permease subunit
MWHIGQVIRATANGGEIMDMFGQVKSVVRELIDIALVLIALAIVLSILVGGTLPFFGSVVDNLTGLVGKLGSNGLVGLIVLGVILWLFSSRGSAPSRR